jgi:hypothetical protein
MDIVDKNTDRGNNENYGNYGIQSNNSGKHRKREYLYAHISA